MTPRPHYGNGISGASTLILLSMRNLLVILAMGLSLSARPMETVPRPAIESITPSALLAHITALASDAFAGRGPGTPGEEKTVAYLVDQCRKMGLAAGNPNGSYVQK